eukprot:tig00000157_g9646.t1
MDVASAAASADAQEAEGKKCKRRVSMSVGYVGTKYSGSQIQTIPGVRTVEESLEKAIYEWGGISEANHGNVSKIGWQRSSRTDKGVHSVGLIVSMKLLVDPARLSPPDPSALSEGTQIGPEYAKEIVAGINSKLPDDIKIFDCRRERNSFGARHDCNYRRYEYLLPVGLLTWRAEEDPAVLNPRPSKKERLAAAAAAAAASAGGEEAAEAGAKKPPRQPAPEVKPEQEPFDPWSERDPPGFDLAAFNRVLSRFEGTGFMHNYTVHHAKRMRKMDEERERLARGDVRSRVGRGGGEAGAGGRGGKRRGDRGGRGGGRGGGGAAGGEEGEGGGGEACAMDEVEGPGAPKEPEAADADADADADAEAEAEAASKRGAEGGEEFPSLDPTLLRTVYEFSCSEPFDVKVGEGRRARVVKLTISGQSFVLHQIRMMTGMALAVYTGYLPEWAIEVSLKAPLRVRIPVAPGSSLLLDQCFYGLDAMREKNRKQAAEMSEASRAEAVTFKESVIYPHVARLVDEEPYWRQFMKNLHTFRLPAEELEELREKNDRWKIEREERKRKRDAERADGGNDSDGEERVLPRGFVTRLCRTFNLLPGQEVADIKRALCEAVERGDLPPSPGIEALLEYVRKHTARELADVGRRIRMRLGGAGEGGAGEGGEGGAGPKE